VHLFLVFAYSVLQVNASGAECYRDEDEGCERHCIGNAVECDVFFHVIIFLFFNATGFEKNIFFEKRIFAFEHAAQFFCDRVHSFLMLPEGAFVFEDSSDFDVVFFGHDFILIYFAVTVKLFSQVFCNLGRSCHFEMARVEQGHLAVMVNVGLVALMLDDAVDFVSDGPELGFLWCLVFHDFSMFDCCD